MKEYFSHDMNARGDIKIKQLIRSHGYTGYGVFWAIIEDLYINANALPTDYEGIAYELRQDSTLIQSIINDFGLFTVNNGTFSSDSVSRRLELMNAKSAKARQSALKRWKDASALRTQSDSNAINKIKESKEKESKEEPEKNSGELPADVTNKPGSADKEQAKGDTPPKQPLPPPPPVAPPPPPLEMLFTEYMKKYPGAAGVSYPILYAKFVMVCKKIKSTAAKEIELIPKAIEDYKASIDKTRVNGFSEAKYKNGTTWINGACWKEDYTVEEVKETKQIHKV